MSVDVTILCSTFDEYSVAWPYYAHGMKTYWHDRPWPIVFSTNFLDPPIGTAAICGPETNWTYMTRMALLSIETEYFLFTHCDYWLVEQVQIDILMRYLGIMDKHDWDHIQLVPSWDVMTRGMQCGEDTSLFWVAKHSDYRTSNQASLWRTEAYLELLKDGESAWQFEVNGSRRARDMKCLCVDQDADWPIKYVYRHLPGWDIEPIVKGVFSHAAVRYCEREGLPYNFKAGEKVVKGG